MSTFDGWETRLYGDAMALPSDELMHFRTKGSKNGVRRYQTESGEWTPLGLKERKAREGWGETRKERRAEKKVAKAEKRAAKAERRTAKINARKERTAALKEKKRLGDISKLTDEELRQKIARVKMEQEYKELTRNPVLKSGEKIVSILMENQAKKAERQAQKEKNVLENNRIRAEVIKAKENTKRALAEAGKARAEADKVKADVKGGLRIARKTDLKKAKIEYRGTTIRGGIARRLNTKMNAGLKEQYTASRKAKGQVEADRILSDGRYNLKKNEAARALKDRNAGIASYEKQQRKLRKERLKTQKEFEKRMKRLGG